ncbi:MAG TPA: hypothetical protein VEC36_01265 [Patescibacteria group bacterium]|nr:hypothetical protein [Patescibacteria group bacterium]
MMEEKVLKMNVKVAIFRYLIWAFIGLFFLSMVVFMGIDKGFSQEIVIVSIPVTLVFFTLIFLPFATDFKEIRIVENAIKVVNLISKREKIIPFNNLREIQFQYTKGYGKNPTVGPYINFSFKNPAKKKLFDDETVTLNNIVNQNEFLIALSKIPSKHMYNSVKVDFEDLANKWYPKI